MNLFAGSFLSCIALIHALRHSPPPIEDACARLWPTPSLMNLLDDSLPADLVRGGALTPAMTARFLALSRYAVDTGAAAMLFTCSAFGPCIDAVNRGFPAIPVLKPNEAMIAETPAHGGRVSLLASFPGSLATTPAEFPPCVAVRTQLAEGTLAALDRGDGAAHDKLAAEAARTLAYRGRRLRCHRPGAVQPRPCRARRDRRGRRPGAHYPGQRGAAAQGDTGVIAVRFFTQVRGWR